MTESKKTNPVPKSDIEPDVTEPVGADEATAAEEPAPEPWTPERVVEWNSYYDVYVALAVLLLAFIVSANKVTHSSIWTQLQLGNLIAAKVAPVTTDPFSYTEEGKPWVNIPWAFEWSHSVLFNAAGDFSPIDPNDSAATAAKAEQVGAGVLIAVNAIARVFTALLLLGIRRKGPGRWWSAICVMLAVGVMAAPTGILLGGLARPAIVSPETWGLLLLAMELRLIFRATENGSRAAAYALIPLFLIWANVDESFLTGLMLLGMVVLGRVRKGRPYEGSARHFSLQFGLGILAACALICLANPSFYRIYPTAMDWVFAFFRPATGTMTSDQFSFFGNAIKEQAIKEYGPDGLWLWRQYIATYVIYVGVGLLSFALNRKRFNLSRFLAYALASLLWGVMIRFSAEFGLVFAVTLALNGQEWYLDTMGSEGRIGLGWSFWSVGGRMVTITALFGGVWMALTGYGLNSADGKFGFGFDRDDFAFESADLLKAAPIQGNVLNTSLNQGDMLIWRSSPVRKTFVDSRRHLFGPELFEKLDTVKKALRDDDIAVWKPILDEAKVSVVMLQPNSAEITYRTLSRSKNWIPFHDDGNTVLFGRADAADKVDVEYFTANRLDPNVRAYQVAKPSAPVNRPPSPMTWMDTVFKARSLAAPQPHNDSARRWLIVPDIDPTTGAMPDPARCLLALREARAAVAAKPDDTYAYRLMADVYRYLMVQESMLLEGKSLPVTNAAAVGNVPLRTDALMSRFRQRVTALSYAIQTTPPPTTEAAKIFLGQLHFELARLYGPVNFIDLARDHLQTALDLAGKGISAEDRVAFETELSTLSERISEVQQKMNDLAVEQQAGPLQVALYALGQGTPGLALHELEEADRTGTNPTVVKPQLLDLYCQTGQPDKAIEMLSALTINDPNFGTEPGVSAWRQGNAYFLLGDSSSAANLWEKYAIPELRRERTLRTVGAAMGLIKGDPLTSTASLLDIPEKVRLQAMWEFDDGMCRLEQGMPEDAAQHLTAALKLSPKFILRPVIAYYLEKLGKPVPPEDPKPVAAEPKKDAPKEAEKK